MYFVPLGFQGYVLLMSLGNGDVKSTYAPHYLKKKLPYFERCSPRYSLLNSADLNLSSKPKTSKDMDEHSNFPLQGKGNSK